MASPQEVRMIVQDIKKRRNAWRISKRAKNNELVSKLGLPQSEILKIVFDKLSWRDYSSGPEMDDHYPPRPGAIWKFGLKIGPYNCYLKFQDKPSGTVLWISIHPAERSMELPYRLGGDMR